SGPPSGQLATQRGGGSSIYVETASLAPAFEYDSVDLASRGSADPTLEDVVPNPNGIALEWVAVTASARLETADVFAGLHLHETDWWKWLLAPVGQDSRDLRSTPLFAAASSLGWVLMHLGEIGYRHRIVQRAVDNLARGPTAESACAAGVFNQAQ